MGLLERIKIIAEREADTITAFERQIGASKGVLSRAISYGSDIQAKWVLTIVEKYPLYSAHWLLTGDGEMLNRGGTVRKEELNIIHRPKSTSQSKSEQVVNLYDLEATAGLRSLLDSKDQNIIDVIRIPDMPRCDGAVHVVGDSMYPILKSGDIILYKEVVDLRSIFWGEMYLLSVAVDDEEYITVKYVQRSDEGSDYIKLVSHNPHHGPKDVRLSTVRALALVKASIRLHTIL